MGDGAVQHGHGGFQRPGLLLALLLLPAQTVGGHVVLLHLPGAVLCVGIGGLLGGLGPVPLDRGTLQVGLQLDDPRPDVLQTVQPHGDFQPPQLVPQHQILLGLVPLGPQRLQLKLQLVHLVVDPQQVLVGALQLALGLLLPVAEAGDARRLLKDLPPVGGPLGEDLVDAALADDGIALPAQAGVQKQLADILQAHRIPVDVVFALPGAVIPPGDHDLVLLPGQPVVAVVQHQRHLGIARLPPLGGAAEDHVLHPASPQGPGGLLPHDPAHCVRQVGLARAVGPHDGGDALVKGQHRLFRKGLKALEHQRLEIHGHTSLSSEDKISLYFTTPTPCFQDFAPEVDGKRGQKIKRERCIFFVVLSCQNIFSML